MVKSLIFTIPLTLIGSIWGVNGIFIGLSVSNILAGVYAAFEMRKELKRSNSELGKVNIWKEYFKDFNRLFEK